jgi:hypothetical protein
LKEEMWKSWSRRHASGGGGEDAGLISFFFCSILLSDCHWDGRVYAWCLFLIVRAMTLTAATIVDNDSIYWWNIFWNNSFEIPIVAGDRVELSHCCDISKQSRRLPKIAKVLCYVVYLLRIEQTSELQSNCSQILRTDQYTLRDAHRCVRTHNQGVCATFR